MWKALLGVMLAYGVAGMCSSASGGAGEAIGARIQRTMRLLATSTPQQRKPVRILFYGQSIVRQDYARKAIEKVLRERYPYADLTVENRAIGGYTAPSLIRTAEHDLYPFYPDLLVFHVYAGEKDGKFEGILRNIRSRTTSEILTWTHHVDRRGADHAVHEDGSRLRRELAETYGCEMVDLREAWKAHLRETGRPIMDFLVDGVHLNKEGGALMGRILVPVLQYHPDVPPTWESMVRVVSARTAAESGAGPIVLDGPWRVRGDAVVGHGGSFKMRFRGNRVDVTAGPVAGESGSARVLIDGKPPSAHPAAYAATLPSKTPIDYRPAIMRVSLGGVPVVETWTLNAHDVSEDGRRWAFDVVGSVTGPDGSGTHERKFVSNSGRIILRPRDVTFRHAVSIRKKPLPTEFKVTWRVWLMGADTWCPESDAAPGKVDRTTLIQGIANADHVLELVPNGDGPVAIKSITVHQPPLDVGF